jgi:hypothetical protein
MLNTHFPLLPAALRIVRPMQNVTKKVGDTVKMKCEAEGDPPPTRFRWLVNEAPLQVRP